MPNHSHFESAIHTSRFRICNKSIIPDITDNESTTKNVLFLKSEMWFDIIVLQCNPESLNAHDFFPNSALHAHLSNPAHQNGHKQSHVQTSRSTNLIARAKTHSKCEPWMIRGRQHTLNECAMHDVTIVLAVLPWPHDSSTTCISKCECALTKDSASPERASSTRKARVGTGTSIGNPPWVVIQ